MEDSSNNCLQDASGIGVQARMDLFLKNALRLDDDNLVAQTTKLLNETNNLLFTNASPAANGMPEEVERYWFAFLLYSVTRLSENVGSQEKVPTLCQILRAAQLNVVEFFREIPQFIIKVQSILCYIYGGDWEKRLKIKELQSDFINLTDLSKHYKRTYQQFFKTVDMNDEKLLSIASSAGHFSDYYRFGWLLFLILRGHALCRFKDLVTYINGLVSILAILVIHVPSQYRNIDVNDAGHIVMKDDKFDLLASLCKMYETPEEELKKMLEKTNSLITSILKKRPCLASENEPRNLENIVADGLTYFEDLLDGSSLSSSIALLDKDYNDMIQNNGDLDERIFINDDDSLLESWSLSGGAVNIGDGIKRNFDSILPQTNTITSPFCSDSSPSLSHHCGYSSGGLSKMVATPVSTAMTTAKWLRTVVAPLPSKPTVELEKFLLSCDKDVTRDVMRRAQVLIESIFPSGGPGQGSSFIDNVWSEQRRLEAMKLYFRVLLAICRAESHILHVINLTSLLTNERFHRCMLACSAEIVLATHKTVVMLFPTVLERTGITAFDLSKVIESFIRHEESLPRELRRHLNSLEERLLESMVWEKGSSMYNSLTVARPTLAGEINRLGLLAEPMPSLDAIAMHVEMSCGVISPPKRERQGQNGDIRSPKRTCTEYRSVLVERNSFTSPVKDRFLVLNNLKSKFPSPALQSAFASPTRPNPSGGGEMCAETEINVFFSKIVKLAAVRINGMVERLQLSHQLRECVYCLFQKILNQRTDLFFNRHIDQIILCSFYGVTKILQLNMTFKEIICNYRKQPQSKPQVFRSVYVKQTAICRQRKSSADHVDIITFYNEIFIPAVKPLLVELTAAGSEDRSNCGQESKCDNYGQTGMCPASPKASSFPSIPDISPRKVSSSYNVYVSPLRSSKMDALISQSSKSYYACVGESTHAYQSPSKDLTVINKHLNGSRNPRAMLTFDNVDVGLVTDSMVANSLYIKNGSDTFSSRVPVKFEQPDS